VPAQTADRISPRCRIAPEVHGRRFLERAPGVRVAHELTMSQALFSPHCIADHGLYRPGGASLRGVTDRRGAFRADALRQIFEHRPRPRTGQRIAAISAEPTGQGCIHDVGAAMHRKRKTCRQTLWPAIGTTWLLDGGKRRTSEATLDRHPSAECHGSVMRRSQEADGAGAEHLANTSSNHLAAAAQSG